MGVRQKKVIIIGAEGYERIDETTRVECFSWTNIKKIKNIRDYDTLIINLLALKDDAKREQVDWEAFSEDLNFHAARDILQHDGEVIVVGDPRFRIPIEDEGVQGESESKQEQDFLNWTDISFKWDSEPGDTVHFVNDYEHRAYEEYIGKISKWDYSLHFCDIDKDKLELHWNLVVCQYCICG